jgi:hypothetical protein
LIVGKIVNKKLLKSSKSQKEKAAKGKKWVSTVRIMIKIIILRRKIV